MDYLHLSLIALAVVWLYTSIVPSRRLRKYANKFSGPKWWPVVGNSHVFFGAKSILETILAACDAYGSITRVWIGKKLMFLLTDPADIEILLRDSKFLEKSLPYRLFDNWLGTKGLLTSNGNIWHQHRKLLTPSFHFKILESSVNPMQQHALKLCQDLTEFVNESEFDIFSIVQKYGVDIICETAMGVDFRKLILNDGHFYRTIYDLGIGNYDSFIVQKKYRSLITRCNTVKDNKSIKDEAQILNYVYYLWAVHRLRTIGMKRFFSPWLHNEWLFKWTIPGQKYYQALRAVDICITSLIKERKKLLEENMVKAETNNETMKNSVKPLLDFMLEDSNFTNEEIENEVQTFMFGGSVTLPTTIAFCLYLLSKHPDVQEKIIQEIEMLKESNEDKELNYHDYNKMKYLEKVIKETLRMYTPVPIIARTITEDLKLSSGHVLPSGSVAGICLLHMHRNEKYFQNADQFIPERFESKDSERHPYAYIPFSAGPRNCIGQKYAMLGIKIAVSTFLQKYRLLPGEKKSLCLESGFVLVSLDKHPVRVSLRSTSKEISKESEIS